MAEWLYSILSVLALVGGAGILALLPVRMASDKNSQGEQ